MGLFTVLVLTFSTVSLHRAAAAREALRRHFDLTLAQFTEDPIISAALAADAQPGPDPDGVREESVS